MGTYKSVPQIRRSGNLCGTKNIVTVKFEGLIMIYYHSSINSLNIFHKFIFTANCLVVAKPSQLFMLKNVQFVRLSLVRLEITVNFVRFFFLDTILSFVTFPHVIVLSMNTQNSY